MSPNNLILLSMKKVLLGNSSTFLRCLFAFCMVVFVAVGAFAQNYSLKKIHYETKARPAISGFRLCETKLSDLTSLSSDFREVEVEEMDFPKACFGKDDRYKSEKGLHS